MLDRLFILPGVHTIKSAQSYVKSRAHFQIYFRYPQEQPRTIATPPRVIHCKEHLLPYEEAPREVPHVVQERTLSAVHDEKDPCSSSCFARQMHVPRSRSLGNACLSLTLLPCRCMPNFGACSYPLEEVDPVSFTCMCFAQRTLYHLRPAMWMFCAA